MNDEEYWDAVIGIPAFAEGVLVATLSSTRSFFTDVRPSTETVAIDWDRHLLGASLVTLEAPEVAQAGALRIVQGCLQDATATQQQKRAAEYLLRRLGNDRAADLAHTRGLVEGQNVESAGPLGLDLIRRTLELSVAGPGDRVSVNHFQRQFWNAAEASRWTSVSAPTSAGKSHVLRLWLSTQIASRERYRAVYLVPTRALIEEVSRELESELGGAATVTTMPWDMRIGAQPHEVLVLTQERLHILLRRQPDMTFDMIFVDEAQKLNDGSRGVLLQRALDEAARRGEPKIIFASPLTSNPELLTEGVAGTSTSLVSETVTVNQTIIHVNQRRGSTTVWDMVAFSDGIDIKIGDFDLPARPTSKRKRLSYVAVALGRRHSGNIVYTNGAAEAETVAGQISELLSSSDWQPSQQVLDVVELVEKTIHPRYLLGTFLKNGVAFHYGNMPLLLREAVERLFRQGEIRYLVCTSTLLEGVNLPCQNLFVRAPKKGNNTLMSPSDFWNLAGRAGRWGVEFQGNIVCIDTNNLNEWVEIPKRRSRKPMGRATDAISSDFQALVNYIHADTPVDTTRRAPLLQALFGILAVTHRRGLTPQELPWLRIDADQRAVLSTLVEAKLEPLTVPSEILELHAGISPLAIQRLHNYFRYRGTREGLELPNPESSDAVEAYTRAVAVCAEYLGADFSNVPGRHFALALLFVDWMRGKPLALLISGRLRWLRGAGRDYSLPVEIRNVLRDVEQYARFEGPLHLACYADVLNAALPAPGGEALPDIAMMMELGVSRVTEVSMMSLGLSRTTVVSLSEHITDDDLSPDASLSWLASRDLTAYDLPALVVEELKDVLLRHADTFPD